MGNLGTYQFMTTCSKKVGGPLVFMGSLVGIGCVLTCSAFRVRSIIKKRRKKKEEENANAIVYTIEKEGVCAKGVFFRVGDRFKVLERDGDAVLIEKEGEKHPEFFLSAAYLSSISNYAS